MRARLQLYSVLAVVVSCWPALAQFPLPNVNTITGFENPIIGDPSLERDVEPCMAVSVKNRDHLFAATITYSTVGAVGPNVPGGSTTDPTILAGAWFRIMESADRGKTWTTRLAPAFPGDTSAAGQASPLLNVVTWLGDPVCAAGTDGRIYLGGLGFNPAFNDTRMFVMIFEDMNNTDGGLTFKYLGTKIIATGSPGGAFGSRVDKGAIAFDPSRTAGAGPEAQGILYYAFADFTGRVSSGEPHTKVVLCRSTDGALTFSCLENINGTIKHNQSVDIGINPSDGTVYMTWSGFFDQAGIYVTRSTDFGQSFPNPVMVSGGGYRQETIRDDPATPSVEPSITFRTSYNPSIAVADDGKAYLAWQARVNATGALDPNGVPRIVLSYTSNFQTWSTPQAIEYGDAFAHQVMPKLLFHGGILSAVWKDFRNDGKPLDPVTGWISGIDRKVDIRAAQASAFAGNGRPTFNSSIQLSKYLPGQKSEPNLLMFMGGTAAFFSDYLYVAPGEQFTPNAGPGISSSAATSSLPFWRWATKTTDHAARVLHAVATDSRDVIYSPNINWQQYVKPIPDAPPDYACTNPGSRNLNIYYFGASQGGVAGSPTTFRKLVNDSGTPVQRVFALYWENQRKRQPGNPSAGHRKIKITVNEPPGVNASFLQFQDINQVVLTAFDNSTVSRDLFVTCSNPCADPTAMFSVDFEEQDLNGVPTGLTSRIFFNTHPNNAPVTLITNGQTFKGTLGPVKSGNDAANSFGSNELGSNELGSNELGSNELGSAPPNLENNDAAAYQLTNTSTATTAYSALLSQPDAQSLSQTYLFNLYLFYINPTPGLAGCKTVEVPHPQVFATLSSNELGSNGLGANELGSNELGSNELGSNELGSNELGSNELGSKPMVQNSMMYVPPPSSAGSHDGTIHPPFRRGGAAVNLKVGCKENSPTPCPPFDLNAFLANLRRGDPSLAFSTGEPATSATTLGCGPATTTYGDPVNCTAGGDSLGGALTGGNVTFVDCGVGTGDCLPKNGFSLGGAVSFASGQAMFTTSPASLGAGVHFLTSFYNQASVNGGAANSFPVDDSTLNPSVVITVNKATPVFSNLSSPSILVGTATTVLSGRIRYTTPASVVLIPTGSVSITLAGTTMFAAINAVTGDFSATFVTGGLIVGSYPITYSYPGDPNFNPINGAGTLTVYSEIFTSTGNMKAARSFHTATRLNNGKVMIIGGKDAKGTSLNTAELYNLAGTFAYTGSAPSKAAGHGAEKLNDGRIFGSGGGDASSFLCDDNGQTCVNGPAMSQRIFHTETLLNNGKVLLAGGSNNSGGDQISTEVFDPVTGAMTSSGDMTVARELHTATRLPNGKVLIVGGRNGPTVLSSAELYDPATGTSALAGAMPGPRHAHTATLLLDGTVLIAGGSNGTTDQVTALIYNPATGAFSFTAGNMGTTTGRRSHSATLLGDGTGRVVITGGLNGNSPLNTAFIYLPNAGIFSPTSNNMAKARANHTATLLSSGKVLITGGTGSDGKSMTGAELLGLTP